jgi:hypothetical protein
VVSGVTFVRKKVKLALLRAFSAKYFAENEILGSGQIGPKVVEFWCRVSRARHLDMYHVSSYIECESVRASSLLSALV